MKVKTSELIDAALDWAVAKCEGVNAEAFRLYYEPTEPTDYDSHGYPEFHYSSIWAQGGPIIERGLIHTYPRFTAGRTEGGSDVYQQDGWAAYVTPPAFWVTPRPFTGPTPLIAAMRCYCCAKLGNEVEVPDELVEGP